MDLRYPHHGNLHFFGYNNDRYGIHARGKDNADYHPQPIIKY